MRGKTLQPTAGSSGFVEYSVGDGPAANALLPIGVSRGWCSEHFKEGVIRVWQYPGCFNRGRGFVFLLPGSLRSMVTLGKGD
jgi:hypothetical protein